MTLTTLSVHQHIINADRALGEALELITKQFEVQRDAIRALPALPAPQAPLFTEESPAKKKRGRPRKSETVTSEMPAAQPEAPVRTTGQQA